MGRREDKTGGKMTEEKQAQENIIGITKRKAVSKTTKQINLEDSLGIDWSE